LAPNFDQGHRDRLCRPIHWQSGLIDGLVDCFPVLFTWSRFSVTSELNQVDVLSARNNAVLDLAWIVTQLAQFLDIAEHCLSIRKALDKILVNNFAIAWPVYISIPTRSIVMDSLATTFDLLYISKTGESEAIFRTRRA
jgi:hypothetical protein